MAKTKLSTFLGSMMLVLFLVPWVSLKTIVKDGNVPVSTNGVKDASSTEWLQPNGDEANKGVSRLYARSSSRRTAGYIYVITMNPCQGHNATPFAKVGYTNDCARRIQELQAGNPHQLICQYTFPVSNRHDSERMAHNALDQQGLRVYCNGGTEWFIVPGGLDDIDEFAEIVRAAIVELMLDEESPEEDRDLAESSINLAPNQAAAKIANSTEWLQPTGDEANKGVSRSYAGSSSRRTAGYIYVITMNPCQGHNATPFAKVGYTNDCARRIQELQAGNPHQLICQYTFPVSNRHDSERMAHNALDQQGLRVYCNGGTEWFIVPGGLDDIDEFAEIVRAAIVELMLDEKSPEEDRDLAESSINLAPNQAAANIATNYGHNNTNWRQDLKGNMLHVKYNCK